MEKFAVDLDKVLDELEFDEDQAENSLSGGKFTMPANNQVVNPLYHMPAFDPMTGTSCITISPPPSSDRSTNGQYRLVGSAGYSWRQGGASQKKSVSGVFSSLNDYISSSDNVPTSVIAPQDDDEDEDDAWEPPKTVVLTDADKKPDVVGTSPNTSLNDAVEVSLPDVAAAVPPPPHEDVTSSLDLINHQSSADPIASACDVSSSETPASSPSSDEQAKEKQNVPLIKFNFTEDLSDSELQLYLDELEAEEEEARNNAVVLPSREDVIVTEPEANEAQAQESPPTKSDAVEEEVQQDVVEESACEVKHEDITSTTTLITLESPPEEVPDSAQKQEVLLEETSSEVPSTTCQEESPVEKCEEPEKVEPPTEEAQQSEPVNSTVNDEEVPQTTEEEALPVEEKCIEGAIAQDASESPAETVCEADSTEVADLVEEQERTVDGEVAGADVECDDSAGEADGGSSVDLLEDKPARPSTLEIPAVQTAECVSSSEEAIAYSEPGPAGATPIATRPPPSEPSGAEESPLQSPDPSEDTSSLELASSGEAPQSATGGAASDAAASDAAASDAAASDAAASDAAASDAAASDAAASDAPGSGTPGGGGGGGGEMALTQEERRLGKEAPVWIPDDEASACMLCGFRFNVIKRRHHCRACGRVVCSKCGSARAPLPFMSNTEARVCVVCHKILLKVQAIEQGAGSERVADDRSGASSAGPPPLGRPPNPNNPMEYCSTVPPLQQAAGALQQPAPTVMVPVVGVLKREGSTKPKSEAKQVMFSDGIRPGGDLTELDGSTEPRLPIRRPSHLSKRVGTPPGSERLGGAGSSLPVMDCHTHSYIPDKEGLPPLATRHKGEITYEKNPDPVEVMALLRDEGSPPLRFALSRNLYVITKIVTLDCCVKRVCWCFTSDGLSCVGQDEVVIVLEVRPDEVTVPKDIFLHINYIYHEAATANTVSEMGHTLAMGQSFLGSDLHAGFLYIRHTTQCVQRLILPPAPFLFGILIHRWEVPWVRIFPIRLMLRLGAEYRYYPCPLISVRERPSVYTEIGDTVIKFLADFRDMAYTLPSVRGLVIHMEGNRVTVLLPRNRYDQVIRALNHSNDHILAFGANFSEAADAHLVCMQAEGEESKYYSSAIEIKYSTRKVTGASFIVFSGGLKPSCGMNAKASVKEDGFVVSVTLETLDGLRAALHDMKDFRIICGPIAAAQGSTSPEKTAAAAPAPANNAASTGAAEEVLLKWTKDDCCFNIGVKSEVDGRPLDGVPSMRVHSGTDYVGGSRFIRWTEVFILQMDEGSGRAGDSVDISRLSGALSKATCHALERLLDLLAAVGIYTLAVRATIHPEDAGYEAGSNGERLPPIYMNSLDDALIPVLLKASANSADGPTVLELVFKVLEQ